MTITYALIQMVEKISERSDLARIINKAKVKTLLTKSGAVCGVTYEKRGKEFTEEGPVILATGGFGADFTEAGHEACDLRCHTVRDLDRYV